MADIPRLHRDCGVGGGDFELVMSNGFHSEHGDDDNNLSPDWWLVMWILLAVGICGWLVWK